MDYSSATQVVVDDDSAGFSTEPMKYRDGDVSNVTYSQFPDPPKWPYYTGIVFSIIIAALCIYLIIMYFVDPYEENQDEDSWTPFYQSIVTLIISILVLIFCFFAIGGLVYKLVSNNNREKQH